MAFLYHEANFLKLNSAKAKSTFNWMPTWNVEEAVKRTVELYRTIYSNGDVNYDINKQIEEYLCKRY